MEFSHFFLGPHYFSGHFSVGVGFVAVLWQFCGSFAVCAACAGENFEHRKPFVAEPV
jgi:hypothetical protein